MGDPVFAARFRRELDAVRRVDSPQVARVLDADPAAAQPWLATEYVEGHTLVRRGRGRRPTARDALLAFAEGVARALAAGVVHRHLKPTNVLLPGARPGVKVIDFGIAWAAAHCPGAHRTTAGDPDRRARSSGREPGAAPGRAPPGGHIRSGASMPIRPRMLARTWRVALTSHQRALERAWSSVRTRHSP